MGTGGDGLSSFRETKANGRSEATSLRPKGASKKSIVFNGFIYIIERKEENAYLLLILTIE